MFVLTDAEEGIKGSGRSIEAYSMYEELSKCQKLLTRYGGHKLAAGLSLEKENIERLRYMLNANCTLQEEDLAEKVVIDMEMPFSCVTEELVQELSLLEPFGKGNTKPVFAAKSVEILSGKILGKNKNVLKLQVQDSAGTQIEAMYFQHIDQFLLELEENYGVFEVESMLAGKKNHIILMLTYYPGMNEYMGKKTPQIVITHFRCQKTLKNPKK